MSRVWRTLRLVVCSAAVVFAAVPLFAGFSGTDVFIPSVGRRPGNLGSQWYTLLWIHNPSGTTANVSIAFLERNVPNPAPLVFTDSIPPGDTRRYPNTVGTLFGVEKWGALRIKANVPVLGSCRMYNLPPGGEDKDTQGQAYNVIPASFAIANGQSTKVLGVHQTSPRDDSQFRYNFGWVETTGGTADVRVIAYDETGAVLGDKIYPTTGGYEPRYYPIEDLVPTINHADVSLEVRVVGGTGKVIAVGSGVANRSNDATTFEMSFSPDLLAPTGPYVSSLNGLSGSVTLAAGANVTITPSGNTLTIAAIGGSGTSLPSGTTGQTLYNNGSAWAATSALTNDGTNVGMSGNLSLPTTTATTGQIQLGSTSFLHNYGPALAGNTFMGESAGNFTMGGPGTDDGKFNTAFGARGLRANTTGKYNSTSGWWSMFSNTTGYANTASGYQSLTLNTTGRDNTAAGANSLAGNMTGSQNTASGSGSLGHSTGDNNTAIGYSSLSTNSTGSQNTAVGSTSLRANTTGWGNAGFGWAAGDTITSGSNNTFLGEGADATVGNLTNAVAIGADAIVDASNKVRIGNASVTVIGGQVAWSNLSDARAKRDVRDLDLGLDFILALRPVQFRMIHGNDRVDFGFLGQDVETLLGDGYNLLGIGADPDRTLSLRYSDFIAPLVKAVQEQQAQIEAQRSEIDHLKAQLAGLEARVAERR
ncbi:MAG: hypothetical protein A2Y78_02845 [Acidobacteria bacterium RBG_13_68_16]|nr:MAG: hypothetical protein A2Y78_02845 [Acidobacteria bacterium RBG_13_68_16]